MDKDLAFIEMIKIHPIIYMNDQKMSLLSKDLYQEALQKAWKDLSNTSQLPVAVCQQRWAEIVSDYSLLKYLINNRKISADVVLSRENTLQAIFTVLYQYLDEKSDTDITSSSLERINKLFLSETSHNKDCNLEDDFGTCDVAITPHANDTSEGSILHTRLNSELIIEDEIKTENDTVEEDEFFVDGMAYTSENISLEDPIPSKTVVNDNMSKNLNCNTATTLSQNTPETNLETNHSNNDMRKFFSELGEVISTELSLEKQKILQEQINDLLKQEFETELVT